MGKKFFTEDDLGIEYIDEQIQISIEELNYTMYILSNKYDRLQDDYYRHTRLGLEGVSDIISSLKETVIKILNRIIPQIKKVFLWIGKKLKLVRDEEQELTKQYATYKMVHGNYPIEVQIKLDKIKSDKRVATSKEVVKKQYKDANLGDILTEEQLGNINTMFQSILYITNDMDPNTFIHLTKDTYGYIKGISTKVKQLSENHINVLPRNKTLKVNKSLSDINKVVIDKIDIDLAHVIQVDWGRLDNKYIAILAYGADKKIYYKSTTIKDTIDYTEKIKKYPTKDIEKIMHYFDKVSKIDYDSTIVDINNVLTSKLKEATTKEYIDNLNNIIKYIPVYCIDLYLGNVILHSNIVKYANYYLAPLKDK